LVVLTKGNQDSPWLNYESGALAKTLPDDPDTRLNALLIDMEASDVITPLKNFQNTAFNKDDFYKAFKQLNDLTEVPLSESAVSGIYEMWWPKLDEKVQKILTRPKPVDLHKPERDQGDMLKEILSLTRSIAREFGEASRASAPSGNASRGNPVEVLSPGVVDAALSTGNVRSVGMGSDRRLDLEFKNTPGDAEWELVLKRIARELPPDVEMLVGAYVFGDEDAALVRSDHVRGRLRTR